LHAKALAGLVPGSHLYSRSDKWKGRSIRTVFDITDRDSEDLYHIVTDASKSVEKDMRNFYQSLLKKEGVKVVEAVEAAASRPQIGGDVTMDSAPHKVDTIGGIGAVQATGVVA
jgi:hypothetical protein